VRKKTWCFIRTRRNHGDLGQSTLDLQALPTVSGICPTSTISYTTVHRRSIWAIHRKHLVMQSQLLPRTTTLRRVPGQCRPHRLTRVWLPSYATLPNHRYCWISHGTITYFWMRNEHLVSLRRAIWFHSMKLMVRSHRLPRRYTRTLQNQDVCAITNLSLCQRVVLVRLAVMNQNLGFHVRMMGATAISLITPTSADIPEPFINRRETDIDVLSLGA
jgi:hypothetical protein